jgi:hypothetical protein
MFERHPIGGFRASNIWGSFYMSINNDQKEFCSLAVGEISPFGISTEGAALHMNRNGLTVELSTVLPTAQEVEAIRGKVPGRAGVVVTGRLGFLVFNLGNGVKFECPFDAGIEDPANVPVLESLTPESRYGVLFVATDPTDRRIFGLRYATLSPRVTQLISQTLRKQIAEPVTTQRYIADVQRAYKRYPSVLDMISAATAFDKIGQ